MVLGVLALLSSASQAQVVTITKPGYTPAKPPVDASATPEGTYSIPASTNKWKIEIDAGTLVKGIFKPWNGVLGITIPVRGDLSRGQDGEYKDGTIRIPSKDRPAKLYLRVRLMEKVGDKWFTRSVTYTLLPTP